MGEARQLSGLEAFQIRRRREGEEVGVFGHLKEAEKDGPSSMARSYTLLLESGKNAGLFKDSYRKARENLCRL